MENLRSLFDVRYMLHGLPADHQFFLIKGTKAWYEHGDINDHGYSFLVAAPTQEQAEAWAKYHFLTNADLGISTAKELNTHLAENEYDSSEGPFSEDYDGWTDLGDNILKTLDSFELIGRKDVETLLKYQLHDDANIYR